MIAHTDCLICSCDHCRLVRIERKLDDALARFATVADLTAKLQAGGRVLADAVAGAEKTE